MNRRQAKRIDLNTPIVLSIEEQEVWGRLLNLSKDGTLFSIDKVDDDKVTGMHLGFDAKFVLKPRSAPVREYTGEIIRLFYKSNDKHIALHFWKKSREIET